MSQLSPLEKIVAKEGTKMITTTYDATIVGAKFYGFRIFAGTTIDELQEDNDSATDVKAKYSAAAAFAGDVLITATDGAGENGRFRKLTVSGQAVILFDE